MQRVNEPGKSHHTNHQSLLTAGKLALLLGALACARPTLAAPQAGAKPAAATGLVTVGVIDGENDAKLPSITIRLDHKPTWSKLDDLQNHGAFLQLTLPGAIVPQSGAFFDGVAPYIPKIAAIQLTPSDAAIRFFVAKDAGKTKDAIKADLLGERIVLTLDTVKLEAALVEPRAASNAGFIERELMGPPSTSALSAEQVIERTEVRGGEPAPSELVKKDPAASTLATGGLDLRDKMVHMATFSGIMFTLLLLSWAAKPYLKKRRQSKGQDPADTAVTMKTLASLSLAPRQKVSLIQVGNERILLGVSADQVTFLSNIAAPGQPAAPRAQQALRQRAASPMELPEGAPEFTKMLATPALDMAPAPVLKKLPGNDYESEQPAPRRTVQRPAAPSPHGAPPQARPKRPAGQRINVSVGEDGIQDNMVPQRPAPRPTAPAPAAPRVASKAAAPAAEGGDGQKAIDDVTRLIREKLKTLRSI